MTMNKEERKVFEKEQQRAKLARRKKRLIERKKTRIRKRDRSAKQKESQSILYSKEALEDEREYKYDRWLEWFESNHPYDESETDECVEEENDKCPICIEEIEASDTLQCSGEHGLDHYFHEHCLKRWIIS